MAVTLFENVPGLLKKPFKHLFAQRVRGASGVDQKLDKPSLKLAWEGLACGMGLV